jgi:predicted ATPase/class 3 adenylate cyclase
MSTSERLEFGEVLRRYRLAAGLTQELLAEQAGLSARGVQDLERGVRQAPYAATVRRLAEALGLTETERATLQVAARRPASDHPPVTTTAAAALPSGLVTFLFTDIESSTRLWQQCRETMGPALARHDELIEGLVAQHRGTVVRPRGEGDSRFAVFARASDAVAAGCAIQLALVHEPWNLPDPMHVRIAIHTGEADQRQGDYYGPAVNRCARLRAVAHGGQVLISAVTADLVREALAAEVTLRDLGEHQLKDLERSERIWQLVHPQLPTEFPVLLTARSSRHNLPSQLTSFIGREQELAEVSRLVSADRLVTLTGVGGAGKTRLALEAASALRERYGDGVWFVDLAPLADALLVPRSIAIAIGIHDAPGRSIHEVLIEYLRDRTVLLLVDNCEHLAGACAEIIDALLHSCARLRVLATSREPLGVAGEALWQVPPLSFPESKPLTEPGDDQISGMLQFEAVRLFVDRARLVVPSFALTERRVAPVAQICKRLDGMPLAIELAAACLPTLSVSQIANRLDQRLTILTSRARSGASRQQTLKATMDWSHELLTEAERIFFRRLAVFAGGWSLDAAETVTSDALLAEEDVLPLLRSLVAKSLIVVAEGTASELDELPESRYRFLETVREYGMERLQQSGELDALRTRHREWCARLAEDAYSGMAGPDQKLWWDVLDAELNNIRAALQCSANDSTSEALVHLSGALGMFWVTRGHWREGMGWLEVALSRSEARPGRDRARVLDMVGELEALSGRVERARASLQESIDLARDAGDLRIVSGALRRLGSLGGLRTARPLLEEALAVSRSAGLNSEIAWNLKALGANLLNSGMSDVAEHLLQESIASSRECGDATAEVSASGVLGQLYAARGDFEPARRILDYGLMLAERLNLSNHILHIHLGDLAAAEQDWDRAEYFYAQCLRLTRTLGIPGPMAIVLRRLAAVRTQSGNYRSAAWILGSVCKTPSPAWNNAFDAPSADEHLANVVRQALGREAFDAAYAEGEALSVRQAATEILQ